MHEWWKDEEQECENLNMFTFLPSIFYIIPTCPSSLLVKHNTALLNLSYLIVDEILEEFDSKMKIYQTRPALYKSCYKGV